MNKTGAKLAGSTHPWRYTPWRESLSRPIYGHTPRKLPALAAISRIIAPRPFDRRSAIVQQAPGQSQGFFEDFFRLFLRFQPLCHGGFQGTKYRGRPNRTTPVSLYIMVQLSRPRPSRSSSWRACRSRHRYRSPAPGRRGCTGRTRRPAPSWRSRRPRPRTTWSWRNRPLSP